MTSALDLADHRDPVEELQSALFRGAKLFEDVYFDRLTLDAVQALAGFCWQDCERLGQQDAEQVHSFLDHRLQEARGIDPSKPAEDPKPMAKKAKEKTA